MSPSFGTSGLRGLVTELTPELVARYTRAFVDVCPTNGTVFVGRDLRPSSPRIADDVMRAAMEVGLDVVDCGAIPTPALAMVSMEHKAAAIMVTGSHIPADRNGLKFYVPTGEISKEDETHIKAAYEASAPTAAAQSGSSRKQADVAEAFAARYVSAFGSDALTGLTIGVYEHSSVARDILSSALEALGATPVSLGRSDTFIPVDTEAVDPETRQMLADWCSTHGLDAICSTDGDADRPMLTDANGNVIPGDILGVLTARLLQADCICTPVSSNDMVRRLPDITDIHLTKIGSPHVIAAMEAKLASDASARVVGFEANGGFLLGFEAHDTGPLAPLMTRDCILPIVATLIAAKRAGQSIANLVEALPPCFTAADRVQDIDRARAGTFLDELVADENAREAFFAPAGAIHSIDLTDGLRINLENGQVVHLRPSGNAPEFRIYAQAETREAALSLVTQFMGRVSEQVL